MKPLPLFVIAILLVTALISPAADYSFVTTSGNSNWTVLSAWSVSGTTPAAAPGAGDNIINPIAGAGGLGVNGSKTVNNWTFSSNQLWEAFGASAGTSTVNITGTFLQQSGTMRFRSNTGLTNLTALNINVLDIQGGLLQAGATTTTIISGFTATTANISGGGLAFSMANGGTATILNLNMNGSGTVAIQPINSGYAATLVVNTLSGTSGSIRTANSNTTVATGTFAVGSGTFGGVISDANVNTVNSTLSLIKTSPGVLSLNGANTYTGGTTITDGTLQVGSGSTSGSITGNVATTSGAAALAFNRSDAYTFSGTVSGSGQLAQVGSGTTTLTAANTYTGTTSVTNGTLLLSAASNNIASSTVVAVGSPGTLNVAGVSGFTLASGQSLVGGGTIVGDITIGAGATLAPGNSPGTMTFNNNLAFASASTSNFEINGLTSGLYDLAQGGVGSQTVSFDGTLNLLFQAGFATNGTVKIFDFENYSGSFTTVNTSGLAVGYTASFNALTGEVTVVPEPGTCALIGLGLGALLMLARSRRRS